MYIVHKSKKIPWLDKQIYEIIKLRNDKPYHSFVAEVNVRYFFAFFIEIFILLTVNRNEKRSDKVDEGLISALEKGDFCNYFRVNLN